MPNVPSICGACGQTGVPDKVVPGSFLVELALWCFFLLPGLIYSLWRITSKHEACPFCQGNRTMVPLDSPRGRQLFGAMHAVVLLCLAIVGCGGGGGDSANEPLQFSCSDESLPRCSADNGGKFVPLGSCGSSTDDSKIMVNACGRRCFLCADYTTQDHDQSVCVKGEEGVAVTPLGYDCVASCDQCHPR